MSGRYFLQKSGQAIVTIVMIVLLNFILFRMMPGSPQRMLISNPNLTADLVAETAKRWGLDRPAFPDQLIAYLAATARGDLGYSWAFRGVPVMDVIGPRVGPTLLLFGTGLALGAAVGILLGAYAAWRRNTASDRTITTGSLVLYATPQFVLGMVLISLLSAQLGWFPSNGMTTTGARGTGIAVVSDVLWHLALPVVAVALPLIGQYVLLMRSSMMEVLPEDYLLVAKAKGLAPSRIRRAHAVPNAMLPVTAMTAVNVGLVFTGSITTEVVFNWPGIGRLAVEALNARDYPLLQAVFLLLAVSIVLANLAGDFLLALVDPRISRLARVSA